MSGNVFLVDSNILVYAFDINDPEKWGKARTLLEQCWKGNIKLAVSVQNLSEFYVIVERKLKSKVNLNDAKQFIKEIREFDNWLVLDFGPDEVLEAIDISQKFNVHYWDALLAATMRQHGIFDIYTENIKDLGKINWLNAVNPFV